MRLICLPAARLSETLATWESRRTLAQAAWRQAASHSSGDGGRRGAPAPRGSSAWWGQASSPRVRGRTPQGLLLSWWMLCASPAAESACRASLPLSGWGGFRRGRGAAPLRGSGSSRARITSRARSPRPTTRRSISTAMRFDRCCTKPVWRRAVGRAGRFRKVAEAFGEIWRGCVLRRRLRRRRFPRP